MLAIFLFVWFFKSNGNHVSNQKDQTKIPEVLDKTVEVEITPNSTYGNLMSEAGIAATVTQAIFDSTKDIYDLSKIRVGRSLALTYELQTDDLKQLVYQIDSEQELYVTKNSTNQWLPKIKPIDYEIKIKTVTGVIETSMYEAAIKNNIDQRAIIDAADAFQWTIDFSMDPRVGDIFKFIYEERYRSGKYIMPGKILAGKYVNEGTEHFVYYFEESADNSGYFDQDGNSVQKMFLKSAVAYKYITSGYTTGSRCLEKFGLCTGHRAIDYAAPMGTPIRSVGDGTITSVGWSRVGYGNLTTIRHNGTYSTNYAHQSRIIVKKGQQVKQGQVIGYVGSTGLSTGPHLHFEMVKNGVKINPLKEILPPGTPIKPENKDRFFSQIGEYQKQLAE